MEKMAIEKRLKPAEFAEKKLVEAILDLTYQPGSALPVERDLARLLVPDQPLEYARYDWGLQVLMVKTTQNPVFKMILNDFASLYAILGERYFFR